MIMKFRAWDTFRNKWVKHFYITENGLIYNMEQMSSESIGAVPIEKSGLVVMQSTGLFDRTGREVYLGDIVRCTSGCPHEVVFLEAYGGTFLGGMPAIYLSGIKEGYAWTGDEEIIGNIYENPELVEVDK
ncbi:MULTISPECIES: YopX family protein [unclassified Streptococcus]|uniref:YopX family protein n=1 Tax=unclassified Streptococcus TaxID=2608887 RepID=UPI00211AA982|nr:MULTISPECIES: YopX family protein [unclassified Streptococcus]MCQ9211836.1 YopX family protein [Streptococcus sp. B01]MCQ9212866.1 YopX family protein [Streptococcus sp. B01]MCQ9212956.1 YopX family protein [Streptococcus sp. O1]